MASPSEPTWHNFSFTEIMSAGEVEVSGTLRADGSLQLDQTPKMLPGPVTVVLRRECPTEAGRPLGGEFFQMMDEIWAGQHARGFAPRAVDDVESEHHRLQAEAEEEIEAAIGLQEESRRLRAQAEGERQSP